jgi:hypothetical protein
MRRLASGSISQSDRASFQGFNGKMRLEPVEVRRPNGGEDARMAEMHEIEYKIFGGLGSLLDGDTATSGTCHDRAH